MPATSPGTTSGGAALRRLQAPTLEGELQHGAAEPRPFRRARALGRSPDYMRIYFVVASSARRKSSSSGRVASGQPV
eukprot:6042435-Alexandrium_andersonii.AAC.1